MTTATTRPIADLLARGAESVVIRSIYSRDFSRRTTPLVWSLQYGGHVKRVAVIGSGGAGKTTFADELGAITGLPVIHLDELYWRPGWVASPSEEWRLTQEVLVARDRWVIDGNYSNTQELRFARADTVIQLALPRRVCITRALWRVVRHWRRDVQAEGCPEHLDGAFLRWLWRFPYDAQPRIDDGIARHEGHLASIRLVSPRAVRRYLDDLARRGPPSS